MDQELAGTSVKDFTPQAAAPKEMGLLGTKVIEFGEQGQGQAPPPSEYDYPLRDWEQAWAEKDHLVYPLARTIADIVPIARYLFPSARDAFERKSTGGQVLELGLEALGLVPMAYFGKGLKIAARGVEATLGLAAKPVTRLFPKFLKPLAEAKVMANPFADELMSDVVKYEHRSLSERLMAKYGLEADEAAAAIKGEKTVWRPVSGPSGGFAPEKSEVLDKLFTKEGTLSHDVLENIAAWSKPREVQELSHYLNQANRIFYKVTAGTKYEATDVFRAGAARVYGESGQAMKLDSVGLDELGNIMRDVLEHGTSYRRVMDISGWSILKPVRKVFGSMDLPWGSYNNFYRPIKELVRLSNTAEVNYVRAWHGMLAGREVEGKPLLEMSVNKLGVTKLTENYTAKEFEAAGKLATDIDLAQSTGKSMAEVQGLMSSAPIKVQAIAKSLHDWYDFMYSDLVKNKIPQLFEEAGLTDKGRAAINGMMSRLGGIADMVSGALRPGNNLDYVGKQLVVDNVLKSIKQLVTKENLDWFVTKELKDITKEELGETVGRLKNLQAELTLRTDGKAVGFPNYLENYTARLPEASTKAWNAERGLPGEMHAGFTKPRVLNEPAGAVKTDIPSLIGARARMQSKELYLYPHIDDYKDVVSKLPPNLKDYATHWLNRILGVPSPIDTKTAQFLGRFSLKGWDERRVVDVAQKLTDMTYMGGIGFKPFSTMRNYVQPVLTTPADMGGVKDILWMAPGMKEVFKPNSREFIRSLGVIQEYAPDLVFNLKVSKFGESKFDKLRDFSMWMYKASDRHTRYWSGGSAIAKWNHYFERLGENGVIPTKNLDAFKSRLGFGSREEWVRRELDNFTKIGTPEAFLEAKKLFVKDVVEESNFIYSMLDSPLIGYKGGALGRVSLVFQSWWMHYADSLGKWLYRTPEVQGKAISATNERLFSFMLSSAVAYEAMQPLWGKQTAVSSVALGPLPLSLSIPPTWKPFFDATRLIADAGALLTPWGDMEATRKQMIQLIKDTAIFAPGGVQTYQMIQGARKEGLSGVLKSIIHLKRDKPKED